LKRFLTQRGPGHPALGACLDAPSSHNVSILTRYNTDRARPVLPLMHGSFSRRAPRDHLSDANRMSVPPHLKTSAPHVRPIHHCVAVPRRVAIPYTAVALHAHPHHAPSPCNMEQCEMQTSLVLLVCNIKISLLQHQNKATATIKQSYYNARCNIRKKRLMQQRNITCCNIKIRLLQQHNKAQCEKATSGKKLMQQRNITCYDIRTRLLQCEIQHQK
jgi:hypothetical protein